MKGYSGRSREEKVYKSLIRVSDLDDPGESAVCDIPFSLRKCSTKGTKLVGLRRKTKPSWPQWTWYSVYVGEKQATALFDIKSRSRLKSRFRLFSPSIEVQGCRLRRSGAKLAIEPTQLYHKHFVVSLFRATDRCTLFIICSLFNYLLVMSSPLRQRPPPYTRALRVGSSFDPWVEDGQLDLSSDSNMDDPKASLARLLMCIVLTRNTHSSAFCSQVTVSGNI